MCTEIQVSRRVLRNVECTQSSHTNTAASTKPFRNSVGLPGTARPPRFWKMERAQGQKQQQHCGDALHNWASAKPRVCVCWCVYNIDLFRPTKRPQHGCWRRRALACCSALPALACAARISWLNSLWANFCYRHPPASWLEKGGLRVHMEGTKKTLDFDSLLARVPLGKG